MTRQRTRSDGDRPRKASRAPVEMGRKPSRVPPIIRSDETTDHPVVFEEEFTAKRTTSVTRPPRPKGDAAPCLVVLSGREEGRIVQLETPDSVTIGRSSECELRLEDEGISRKHARLVIARQGAFVEDLGSRNGTFVGETRIDRCPLQSGDLIRIGSASTLKFAWMDATEQELHARMQAAALRDALTGLYNRRHFDECLATERASAERHRKPLSLIVLDLDNFKRVNDEHGHPVGDAVLAAVSRALQRCARREDLVFRFGGEEFAILARDTDLEGARRFAERAREEIAGAEVTGKGGTILRFTASLGVAQLRKKEGEAGLLARADTAMYAAKHAGKNQVSVSERKLSPVV